MNIDNLDEVVRLSVELSNISGAIDEMKRIYDDPDSPPLDGSFDLIDVNSDCNLCLSNTGAHSEIIEAIRNILVSKKMRTIKAIEAL